MKIILMMKIFMMMKKFNSDKKIPVRKCVGCSLLNNKNEMIRIVKTSDNSFQIDHSAKLNGKGAYICKNNECLAKAIKLHGLERSFKMSIPNEVYDDLKRSFE